MKRLTGKTRAILAKNRGESLMECIASILIFTILFATVSLMINTSLVMTARSTADADKMQNAANAARLLEGSALGVLDDTATLTLNSHDDDDNEIAVTIPITITTEVTEKGESFTAFAFREVTPP